MHFTLIDPDKQSPSTAAQMARKCMLYGTDAIMVGGSTINHRVQVDKTIKEIRGVVGIPVIQFPNSASVVSRYADYIFFMSLLNSMTNKYLLSEQVKSAITIKKFKITPISMGYLVFSMSRKPTTVERVIGRNNLDVITERDIEKIQSYALTAQYLGLGCIYLEAGSNADKSIPPHIISIVRSIVKIPIIVGGGIRDKKTAREKVVAGADVVVTGTIGETVCDAVRDIIKGIDGVGGM